MTEPIYIGNILMIFWGQTYDVSPNDLQRPHPLMNLGVKLFVPFVQIALKMSGLQICLRQLYSYLL